MVRVADSLRLHSRIGWGISQSFHCLVKIVSKVQTLVPDMAPTLGLAFASQFKIGHSASYYGKFSDSPTSLTRLAEGRNCLLGVNSAGSGVRFTSCEDL